MTAVRVVEAEAVVVDIADKANLAPVVPLPNAPSVVRGYAADWWTTHERGTNDRPRPGTRLRLHDGRGAIVQAYEGCWHATTFPVLVDGYPGTLLAIASDVAAEL